MKLHPASRGFTLVEIAIVLVIIGIIAAGILVGTTLKKEAEVRSVITKLEKYKTAFLTFKLTYDAYPGDMENAYDYWETTCDSSEDNCNGDGNRLLEWGTYTDNEVLRAWQHLTLSKILTGYYTGYYSGSSLPDTPKAFDSDCSFMYYYVSSYTPESNALILNGFSGNGAFPDYACTSPLNLYTIDGKIDDAKPTTGIIRAADGADVTAGTCVSSSTYQVQNSEDYCLLRYLFIRR